MGTRRKRQKTLEKQKDEKQENYEKIKLYC
jgi:hypothetical protein